MSGPHVSLRYHEANEDTGSQSPLSSDGGQDSNSTNEAMSFGWSTVYPLLFASLHPLLAPIIYAYRYDRLRGEILKAVCDSLSLCFNHDKSTSSCTNSSRLTNKGFNSTSTYGGTPCIRQTIAIPVTEATAMSENAKTTLVNDKHYDVANKSPARPSIVVSTCEPYDSSNFIPESTFGETSRNPNISIQIDSVDETGPQDPICVPQESRSNSPVILRRQDSSVDCNDGSVGMVRMERSMGNFVNCLTVWMNSYSRRWLQHRESVTSTASFITLLSHKYHNKSQPVANV
jgi:hypothetical protein